MMKGIFRAIRDGLLMTGIFMLVASAHHASAQEISSQKVLDVSQYETREQFDNAVQTYFKNGGKVDALLKVLNESWKPYSEVKNIYSKSDTRLGRYLERTFFNEHAFEKVIDVGSGNKNVWRILIVENSFLFKRYQTQLIFDDEDFSQRGIPFQFKYFDDISFKSGKRISSALESILKSGGLPTVEKELQAAGAKKYFGQSEPELSSGIGYKYRPDYRSISIFSSEWVVSVWLDKDKNVKSISANPPHVVMP